MKKSPEGLLALGMLFAVALVLSNVVAAKVVATAIPFPGGALAWDFEVPPGAVAEVSFAGERADFAAGWHHLESNRSQLGGIPS